MILLFTESINKFKESFQALEDEKNTLTISEWAEEKRYLPKELTPNPGFWSNDITPYLVEPMDCLSPSSPIARLIIMKGTQGGWTTGLIENFIGYTIDQDPSSFMYISADQKMTEDAIELKIDKMIDTCADLREKIKPAIVKRHNKQSGDTKSKKEFPGGFLLAIGARSAGKLRSNTIKKLMFDEVDGYPREVGKEGDPINLAEQRTKNFPYTKKVCYISTPTILQISRIAALFDEGDKREYHIPCPSCNTMQTLHFFINKEKNNSGLHWEVDSNKRLIPESVYYQCINHKCNYKIRNFEKPFFLGKGQWIPEQNHAPVDKTTRSYFWTPLLSPWHPWDKMIVSWLKARTYEEKKSFWNTELGLPWEEMGETPDIVKVNSHRRLYQAKTIPNKLVQKETNGKILFLTVAVDTQDNGLYYDVSGWSKDGNLWGIDFDFIKGNTEKIEVWQKLKETVYDNAEYEDDFGQKYKTYFGVIDAGGHRTTETYKHCMDYPIPFLFPLMGQRYIRGESGKAIPWQKQKDKPGFPGLQVFSINTTWYKNELAKKLKQDRQRDTQPKGYLNFPENYGQKYFDQYASEQYVIEKDPRTGKPKLLYWKQIGQRANHAWDLAVYQQFALEIFAYTVCTQMLGLETLDYISFWECANKGTFKT